MTGKENTLFWGLMDLAVSDSRIHRHPWDHVESGHRISSRENIPSCCRIHPRIHLPWTCQACSTAYRRGGWRSCKWLRAIYKWCIRGQVTQLQIEHGLVNQLWTRAGTVETNIISEELMRHRPEIHNAHWLIEKTFLPKLDTNQCEKGELEAEGEEDMVIVKVDRKPLSQMLFWIITYVPKQGLAMGWTGHRVQPIASHFTILSIIASFRLSNSHDFNSQIYSGCIWSIYSGTPYHIAVSHALNSRMANSRNTYFINILEQVTNQHAHAQTMNVLHM